MSSIAPKISQDNNPDRSTIGYLTVQKREFNRATGTAVNTLGFSVFDAKQFKGENREKLKGIINNLVLVTIENGKFKEIHFTPRAYDYVKSKNLTHCSHRGTLVPYKVEFIPNLSEEGFRILQENVKLGTDPNVRPFHKIKLVL